MITVVFRPDPEAPLIRIALVAVGGRNRLDAAVDRHSFAEASPGECLGPAARAILR
jgi:hypothetical protein